MSRLSRCAPGWPAARLTLALLAAAACSDKVTAPPANNPVPVLLSADSTSVTVGGSATTLTLTGEGFIRSSRVRWNDADRPTTFVNDSTLRVTLGGADLAVTTTGKLLVYNPPPGGGTSGTLTIASVNPRPAIGTLSPTSADMGGAGFTLTVDGTNFVPGATIMFGSQWLQTTRESATRLKAAIPASLLGSGGTVNVTVSNPGPGGGQSAPVPFAVMLPVPQLTGLTPDTAYTGTPLYCPVRTITRPSKNTVGPEG